MSYVIKRNGQPEAVNFNKITERLTKMCRLDPPLHDTVDPVKIAQVVIAGMYDNIHTTELDRLAAENAASYATRHPDFSRLAARIEVSNLQKETNASFAATAQTLATYTNSKTQKFSPLIDPDLNLLIQTHAERLDQVIVHERDFLLDYFGFMTLQRAYLLKIEGQILERPQYMFLRVALGIHGEDLDAAIETYHLMSQFHFIHATPTLFNAGTPRPQMSSCFLLTMQDDSIDGIFDTLGQCARISKYAGGIGVSMHKIRASGSYIGGTGGHSNGLVPMLRVYNETARYVDQGGGKRKGSFAIYLEPWHADVESFLDLKKNHGQEEQRARDLFYALWVNDLFMERVRDNGSWSLFCPNEAPGLADVWGEEFNALYRKYEKTPGLARKVMRAQVLFESICRAQIETGTPYMLYKDACNRKSNQQNLGTIRSSNLCTEIIEYTAPDEVAVCNLASINLSKFVNREAGTYDFDELVRVTKIVTRNLNKVIDRNFYPIPEAERSNLRHRPIGIGVQGLADTFALLRYPFESAKAAQLNRDIFEAIYFGAVTASMELAQVEGAYETFAGSPLSKGQFQFDLWGVKPSPRFDWETLRAQIMVHGVRNSQFVALMPTASTSNIMGNNECFEAFTNNLYTRRVLSGEFILFNRHLLRDLIDRGRWNAAMSQALIRHRGSVQQLPIPDDLKALYKTTWEIKARTVLDMAADRGAFVDQSQSMNIHMAAPTVQKVSKLHMYAWRKGLKTGQYYLRTRPVRDAIQFTVAQEPTATAMPTVEVPEIPNSIVSDTDFTAGLDLDFSKPKDEECVMCGS